MHVVSFWHVAHTHLFCSYMVQWPGIRILRRQELDAFLSQALSPKLYEPEQLQELKVRIITCYCIDPDINVSQ